MTAGAQAMPARIVLAVLLAVALPALAATRIKVADEGNLEQWSLVPGTQLMPPYPDAYAAHPEEVCLVVGYLVNADGTTSDFSLLKSWTSGSNARNRTEFWAKFGEFASRALAQWRYAPRNGGSAQPVYTSATFVFGAPQAALDTRAHCIMQSLSERLAELRYDARASRQMTGGIFSRLEFDPATEDRIRQDVLARREAEERSVMKRADDMASGMQQVTSDQPFPPTSN
jgi:hypothetical protein